MKKLICLLALILSTSLLHADGFVRQTLAATGATPSVNQVGGGIAYYRVVWNVVGGTLSGCSFTIDSSADNITFTPGGIKTATACPTNGDTLVQGPVIANYSRINLTTFTAASGTPNITFSYFLCANVNCPATSGTLTSGTVLPTTPCVNGTLFSLNTASGNNFIDLYECLNQVWVPTHSTPYIVTNPSTTDPATNTQAGTFNDIVNKCKAGPNAGIINFAFGGLYYAGSYSLGTQGGLICRVVATPGVELRPNQFDVSLRWGCAYGGSGWYGQGFPHSVPAGFNVGRDEFKINGGSIVQPYWLISPCMLDNTQQAIGIYGIHFQNCTGCLANSPVNGVVHLTGFSGMAITQSAMDTNWGNTRELFLDNPIPSGISLPVAPTTMSVLCGSAASLAADRCRATFSAKVATDPGGTTTPTAHFMWMVPGDLAVTSKFDMSGCAGAGTPPNGTNQAPVALINNLSFDFIFAGAGNGTYTACHYFAMNNADAANNANTSVVNIDNVIITGNHNAGVLPFVGSHNGIAGTCGAFNKINVTKSETDGAGTGLFDMQFRSNAAGQGTSSSCDKGSNVNNSILVDGHHIESTSDPTSGGLWCEGCKSSTFRNIDGSSGGSPTLSASQCGGIGAPAGQCSLLFFSALAGVNSVLTGNQVQNAVGNNWGYVLNNSFTGERRLGTVTDDPAAFAANSRVASYRSENVLAYKTAQSAAIGSTTLVPAGVVDTPDAYRIDWWIKVTGACTTGTGGISLQINFNDGTLARTTEAGQFGAVGAPATKIPIPTTTLTATNQAGGSFVVQANTNTAVTYQTNYTACATGTGTYDIWVQATDVIP